MLSQGSRKHRRIPMGKETSGGRLAGRDGDGAAGRTLPIARDRKEPDPVKSLDDRAAAILMSSCHGVEGWKRALLASMALRRFRIAELAEIAGGGVLGQKAVRIFRFMGAIQRNSSGRFEATLDGRKMAEALIRSGYITRSDMADLFTRHYARFGHRLRIENVGVDWESRSIGKRAEFTEKRAVSGEQSIAGTGEGGEGGCP